MPADIEPVPLAELVDFAERPRTREWSLRAALVRYAQPQPQRVNDILELVRRTEWALGAHTAEISRNGQALWDALSAGDAARTDANLVGLLSAASELDQLGDVLAVWAIDPSGPAPDADVDRVVADVGRRLEALGVPREERPPGPRSRG
jgi:hypothetical protein